MNDENDLSDPEASYRRGYSHGAWDVINAVADKLSPADQQELHRWFENDVREWRLKHMRGEEREVPPGHYAAAPPRQKLRISGIR